MKKLITIFTVFFTVMFYALGILKVSAEESRNYSLTINGTTVGHTYEVYQIFKGEISEDGKTLSNIGWSSDVTSFTFEEKKGVTDIVDLLGKENDDSNKVKEFAFEAGRHLKEKPSTSVVSTADKTILSGLKPGYYLVKDKDFSQEATNKKTNTSYTRFILKVVGDAEATLKSDIPTVEKKVKDKNDTTGVESNWQDAADCDFNDQVPFKLTVTLPSNFDDYQTYNLEFVDTLSKGLKYNEDAKVYLENEGKNRVEVTDKFKINKNINELQISIENLQSIEDQKINSKTKVVVEYTETLTSEAVIGGQGNRNEVELVYSNNPNSKSDGQGRTPKDVVIVFTYRTIVNKQDRDGKALTGAGFTLYKKVKNDWKKVGEEIKGSELTKFEFKGLDAGDYKLEETTTPSGYNTIKPLEFTITAEYTIESAMPTLNKLSGNEELKFTSNLQDGSLSTNVINKKGSLLPSTGSVETKMLYLIGALFAISLAVLLVTKKRVDLK
ncbi:isopeptide-forming domain-containing fimbrial protein [Streptococcus suis]|uniref:isopeptide-forming domain-containing fimbrial protein n=1 Tax=Streptococcus suis TaxID=1307 RepID=UPI001F3D6821|nr:isopeptide-forming domain-containing fimbrial protein [Streptococcus suis]MCE6985700.1 isopeptide-forming domain-containing fimbrial protein [Streptococcus suis]